MWTRTNNRDFKLDLYQKIGTKRNVRIDFSILYSWVEKTEHEHEHVNTEKHIK